MKFYLSCLLVFFFSCSTDKIKENNDKIAVAAEGFVSEYFNLRLSSSLKYCTPESGKWIKFYAGNITSADLDAFRAAKESVSYEIKDIYMLSDTSATVSFMVLNSLCVDDIETAGRVVDEAVFNIPMVKRDGRWLVKMESLLRSERQSRD